METMITNLRVIKRKLRELSNESFMESLSLLLKKYKLPSDNELGPYLRLYNIVREDDGEYVFNGRFMYTIYGMALRRLEKDLQEFHNFDN